MSELDWLRVGTEADNLEPLNADRLADLMRNAMERNIAEAQNRATRVQLFLGSVPERVRGHPEIVGMVALISSGAILHPEDHKRLIARYKEIVRG